MQSGYRDILSQVFRERSGANPQYSLRSYARDLGVAPSSLSEVLNGKKGLSPQRSAAFAEALRLPDWQARLFCDLVALEHAKSPRAREEAKIRLQDRHQENQVRLLNQNALRALLSWVDLAILELTYLKDFQSNLAWIAKRLGVEKALATESVKRLLAAKLLSVDPASGRWTDVSPLFSSTDGVPSESLRNFHRTVLNLALKKLDNPDVNARTVKSVVFSVSERNRDRAKKILDEAIAQLVALADESAQERSDVLCFSGQLFSLLPKETS